MTDDMSPDDSATDCTHTIYDENGDPITVEERPDEPFRAGGYAILYDDGGEVVVQTLAHGFTEDGEPIFRIIDTERQEDRGLVSSIDEVLGLVPAVEVE